mmetsp:Transcript_2891/g.4730  ORF Transcript_2891/g.4730 Transcript_2891/m.4730 type:complete len:103 (+) Transcript_2891:95-403(+)
MTIVMLEALSLSSPHTLSPCAPHTDRHIVGVPSGHPVPSLWDSTGPLFVPSRHPSPSPPCMLARRGSSELWHYLGYFGSKLHDARLIQVALEDKLIGFCSGS